MFNLTQRRRTCLAIAVATVIAGLIWRLVPLGLPPFLFKYGGSALWAVMVYWLVAAALPRSRPITIASTACLLAAAVELSRLIHTPVSDAFRITLAGRLLLGRYFAWLDIAVYWLAIAATSTFDARISRHTDT
jgi:hypothetical protein